MLPGPIFRREVKAAARRRDLFLTRMVLALLLGGVVAGTYGFAVIDRVSNGILDDPELMRSYAAIVFAIAVGVEILFLALLTTQTVSVSIAQEREKDTLPILLLTRLTRVELVVTKLAARLMPSFLLMLTGLPLLLLSAWFAELPVRIVIEAAAVLVTTTIVAGSLAILASSRHERTTSAGGEAFGWTILWLVLFPFLTRLPVRLGTLWGELLAELRRLCLWIAPSSPVSLLTNFSWLSGAGFRTLSDRLVTMLALQGILIVLALSGAVASLRLREPHPHAKDPHRGYRPPVGDDPILWREYVLPLRGSRLPMVVILARQMLILFWAVFLMLLQLVILALAVVVPIGMVIGAGWFGYFAFWELWEHGYQSVATWSYQARERLNLFIRGATAILGVAPLLVASAGMTDRIQFERNKKTWESLLTTPLTGAEILSSKMQVTVRILWSAGRWLIPLWVLGIACDGLHPLGVLVAAVELPMAAWAGLALGTWLAIRPRSTTHTAPVSAAMASLGLMFLGGLLVVAPLGSGRQLRQLRAGDDRLFWLALVVLLAAALMLGTFARFLTRRCFQRFDEWVGRPHRTAGSAAEQRARTGAGVHPADPGATASVPYRVNLATDAKGSVP